MVIIIIIINSFIIQLTLRLYTDLFLEQTKFSGQISLEIGKGIAWPPFPKKSRY